MRDLTSNPITAEDVAFAVREVIAREEPATANITALLYLETFLMRNRMQLTAFLEEEQPHAKPREKHTKLNLTELQQLANKSLECQRRQCEARLKTFEYKGVSRRGSLVFDGKCDIGYPWPEYSSYRLYVRENEAKELRAEFNEDDFSSPPILPENKSKLYSVWQRLVNRWNNS